MRARVEMAVVLAGALLATGCGGAASGADDAAPVTVPVLQGIERSTTDGQRRIDTEIDPEQLVAPPPPTPLIGTMALPCSTGDGPPVPSAETGVDGTTVTIATGNDRGGLYTAGSARGVSDAVRAAADRCNALGGIAGRQIVVIEHDAAVVEVVDAMTDACEAFAIVGQGYLWDTLAEPTRLECGLPSFPAWTTTRPGALGLTATALTRHPAEMSLDPILLALFGGVSTEAVAIIVPESAGGTALAGRHRLAIELSALDLHVEVFTYPLDREPDWAEMTANARRSGAGIAFVSGSCRDTLAPLVEAAAAGDWQPTFITGPDGHDPACAASWPALLEGVVTVLPMQPPESFRPSPAIDEISWLLEASAVEVNADSLSAVSAFWLWATAANPCADDLTRECLIESAHSLISWSSGGLHGATDPGDASLASGCDVTLLIRDGSYTRIVPEEPGELACEHQLVVDVG